jgi:basic amino acid/polyamine antiporter, APA family
MGSPEAFKAGLEANAASMFGTERVSTMRRFNSGRKQARSLPLRAVGLAVVFLVIPYMVFFNLWPNWGATLYGEVRGATDFKRNMAGMGWALGATTLLAISCCLPFAKPSAGSSTFSRAQHGGIMPGATQMFSPLPVWPYPALLAAFLTTNKFVQFLVVALMSLWWFGWCATVFLSSTRVIFAAAFDRLLPEAVARSMSAPARLSMRCC